MYKIYMHICKTNGWVYVGKTCQEPSKRFGSNFSGYLHKDENGKYEQPAFANAINKYGADNFITIILYDGLTKEQAILYEEDQIAKHWYHSYNCKKSSDGFSSEQSKQLWQDENYRNKIIQAAKDYFADEDNKKEHSEACKKSYEGNTIAHDRAIKNHQLNQEAITEGIIKSWGRPVKCIETGKEYICQRDYLIWLAEQCNSNWKALSKQAKKHAGKKWKNYTFIYLDE